MFIYILLQTTSSWNQWMRQFCYWVNCLTVFSMELTLLSVLLVAILQSITKPEWVKYVENHAIIVTTVILCLVLSAIMTENFVKPAEDTVPVSPLCIPWKQEVILYCPGVCFSEKPLEIPWFIYAIQYVFSLPLADLQDYPCPCTF